MLWPVDALPRCGKGRGDWRATWEQQIDGGRMCLRSPFLQFAEILICLGGMAKAFSAIGPARALGVPDPLIGIPLGQLMLLVGLVV